MALSAVLLIALLGVAVLAYHAIAVATTDLRVTELDVPLPGLGPDLAGYTLAVLADLHHRPFASYDYLDRLALAVREARPDVVLLLGDYGMSFKYMRFPNRRAYRKALRGVARLVGRLEAPDGVLGVLGNHDHYADADAVTKALRQIGVRVLENSCVEFRRGDSALLIGGVGDVREGIVDPAGGCGGFPAELPRVVISHNPDGVFALDPGARIDLVLSGHTHGGQVVLPLFGAPVTMSRLCTRRTASGWVPNDRAPLYVTRGIGCQIPMRFCCPPELLIVRLRRADQQPA
jgi:predicted MPP superfamily phosphohydrolase